MIPTGFPAWKLPRQRRKIKIETVQVLLEQVMQSYRRNMNNSYGFLVKCKYLSYFHMFFSEKHGNIIIYIRKPAENLKNVEFF
jgi:hypothetical protein